MTERSSSPTEQARIAGAGVRRLAARLEQDPAWQRFVETKRHLLRGPPRWYDDPKTRSERLLWEIVGFWEESSAGELLTVALQEAAAEEFGMDMAARPRTRDRILMQEWREKFADADTRAGLRALVRTVYQETQEWIRARGIASPVVMPGLATEEPLPGLKCGATLAGQRAQPVLSFSGRADVAVDFAGPGVRKQQSRGVSVTEVPAGTILGLGQTGFGVIEEAEAVVIGGKE